VEAPHITKFQKLKKQTLMSSGNVEKIKERLDIVDVLGSYLKLEKAGANYKAKCPFHNEKSASFFVSPERQSFYCFGCQAKGDIFTFVERFEGLDFKGSLKHLADRAGVKLEWAQKPEEQDKRDRVFSIMEASTMFFEKNLKKEMTAGVYLEKRGISKKSISDWRVGFALPEWRTALEELEAHGFKKPDILDAGMVKKTEDGKKYYDTFRGRLMFPIFDTAGRVIAFSGRIMHDDGKSPKYLNSPETELFKKSEVLYGFNFAKAEIRRLDYTILVEGQMDLVLSHQAGTKNTVASSGTAFTLAHLEKIKKLSNKILVAYDADDAGRKAAKKVGEMALSLGMEVKIAVLPEGEDPASVIQNSPEEWKNAIAGAVDLISFLTKNAVTKHKGHSIKLAKELKEEVIPVMASVESEIVKSQYVSLVSRMAKVPEESIWTDLKKAEKSKRGQIGFGVPDEQEIVREEEMLSSIILWQESSKDKMLDVKGARKRFEELLGKSVEEAVEGKNKEALIFQAEDKWRLSDLNNSLNKSFDEILLRLAKKDLENRLKALAEKIDFCDGDQREELKKEAEIISKQLSQII
jgi:DNA primase